MAAHDAAAPGGAPAAKRAKVEDLPELEVRTYQPQRILGRGSFGVVYQAKVMETGDTVAIKAIRTIKALSSRSFRQGNNDPDREVQILKELHGHPNIVCLHGAFLSDVGKDPKLNLVLEFLSDTLHRVLKHYNQMGKNMEDYYIKLYTYQLMRGLAFVHGKGIIHVDVKPQNLLLDGGSHTLKICDFGTAKRMSLGKQCVSYACSRYYRAPELSLGATTYTVAVDLWSAGCVFAEMFIGQPLFTGNDGIDQFVEIVKVLGTPTREDLRAMNPNYPEYDFTPSLQPHAWEKVFRGLAPREATDLAGSMLRFNPAARMPALQCIMHRFFDSLRIDEREAHRRLFEFVPEELDWCTATDREKLIPRWVATRVRVKPEPP